MDYNEYLLRELVETSSEPISIDKDLPGTIKISIDPDIMFSNLNPSYWNSANNSQINGQNGIKITNSENSNMYNQVHSKIGESFPIKPHPNSYPFDIYKEKNTQ